MRAVTWQGKRDVRVEIVPDPAIQEPTDAIVLVTSSGICGGRRGHPHRSGRPRRRPLQRLLRALLDVRQAVEYAAVPPGGSVAVLGLGPIGDMSCRIALQRGAGQVIGIDLVPERLARARARGVEVFDVGDDGDSIGEAVRSLTGGRGPDAVIDAVGMEAHGAPFGTLAQRLAGLLPDAIAARLIETAGVDRLSALHLAIDLVRRGGTISISGVYGGMLDPLPMMTLFDKQIQVRVGQANVRRWIDEILPLLTDSDPLGVDDFATHRVPLDRAPEAYEMFQRKEDGAVKVLLAP